MIIANQKPIAVIGYKQGSMTHEFVNEISRTHSPVVIEPPDFFDLENREQYQYIAADWMDLRERESVIDLLDAENLDLITVIHDTVVLGNAPPPIVHPGTFIFPFCKISIHSVIGRHSIISPYTLIGHYSTIGTGCIIRPGVIIAGRAQIGNKCYLSVRSTVANYAKVTNGVELLASSSLYKDALVPGKYAGTPARLIK